MAGHKTRVLLRRQVRATLNSLREFCEVYWDLIPMDNTFPAKSVKFVKDPEWNYAAFQMLRYADLQGLGSLESRWEWVEEHLRRFLIAKATQEHRAVYRDMLRYYRNESEQTADS